VRVVELWRYPVKSMQGESLSEAEIRVDGIVGDRRFALVDVVTGELLTARADPQLLFAVARLRADDSLEIVLPDGSIAADDDALSAWLGRPVRLRSDGGPFPDDDQQAPLSLVSTATLGDWAPRRFRSNVLLDGGGEDALVGSRVDLGGARLNLTIRIDRCVMVTRPQQGIDRDNQVLRTIHRERGGALAIGATVVRPGVVRIGELLSPHEPPPT
jgi:uncharacterized protein YcbX